MRKIISSLFLLAFCMRLCAQSNIVQIGEAVIKCDNFKFSKELLQNEGLFEREPLKDNLEALAGNCITFSNGSNSMYGILFVELYRPDIKGVQKVVLSFNPNGKFQKSLLQSMQKFGYRPDYSVSTQYRELWTAQGNHHMGLDINKKGWMMATFFKGDPIADLNIVFDGVDPNTDWNCTEIDDETIAYLKRNGVYFDNEKLCWRHNGDLPRRRKSTSKDIDTNEKDEHSETQNYIEETPPEYPGGDEALLAFIRKNLKYPKDAYNEGIEGRVVVEYSVMADGSVDRVRIKRGLYPSLDEEAIRVIKLLKGWKPATQAGKPINCSLTMPIIFRQPH